MRGQATVLKLIFVMLCGFSRVSSAASHLALPRRPPECQVSEQSVIFGHSVEHRPLQVFLLGDGPNKTLIVGGMHGNERSGPGVVEKLRAYLQHHPDQWPNCQVLLVPYANPDGWKARTRVNAHRVDINRNFPGSWTPVAQKTRYNPGPSAASEPETRALMALIDHYSPTKVISIHQPLHLLNWTGLGGRNLAAVMGRYDHYPISNTVGYATPGAFGDYCGKRGIAIVTLEMPRVSVTQGWQQNRAALMAAIKYQE